MLLAGNVPWAGFGPVGGLLAWNRSAGLAVPWAIAPMAAYLWLYLAYLGGRLGTTDAASRRANLRANRLSGAVWRAALPAGLLGFAAILGFLAVLARLVRLPEGGAIQAPPGMPAPTMFALVSMSSVVAGVTEECAFRGYMQSLVERRYGLLVAILANGTLFGLLHFPSHPSGVLGMLPYYIGVSAVYGGLTWAADSILPAMVLHVVGDVVVLTRWWLTGRPEWQLGAVAPPQVRESGIDASFVGATLVALVLALLTAWSFRRVREMRPRAAPRSHRRSG